MSTKQSVARAAAARLTTSPSRQEAFYGQYLAWIESKASESAARDALEAAMGTSKRLPVVLNQAEVLYGDLEDFTAGAGATPVQPGPTTQAGFYTQVPVEGGYVNYVDGTAQPVTVAESDLNDCSLDYWVLESGKFLLTRPGLYRVALYADLSAGPDTDGPLGPGQLIALLYGIQPNEQPDYAASVLLSAPIPLEGLDANGFVDSDAFVAVQHVTTMVVQHPTWLYLSTSFTAAMPALNGTMGFDVSVAPLLLL